MRHNGQWRERHWWRIEDEFHAPALEVVRVMHYEMNIPLRHVAGALCVCETTLREWCETWGLETRRKGLARIKAEGHVQKRAKELGFDTVSQAIECLRANGKQWNETKELLRCSDATLCRYLTPDARGYYHLSAHGLEVKREVMKRLNEKNHSQNMPPLCYVVPRGRP